MSETGDDLPPGWARTRLKDIGSWTGGGTPSKRQPAYWTDGTIPWVSPKDMKTDFIFEAEDAITERAVEESSAKRIEAGSVLFVTRSGILRHTLPVAVNRVDVTVNQDLKALTPASGIEPAYVLRFVQAFNREMLRATSKDGTTVQSVQTKKLYDYSIPVAPTAEQLRIVDALESALDDLDAGVAAIEASERDLERYRRSVLKAAVEGDLTADWRRQHPEAESASALLKRVLEERRERWKADQLAKYETKGKTPPKGWRQRYKPPTEPETEGLPGVPEGWAWASIDQLASHEDRSITDGPFGSNLKSSHYTDKGPRVIRLQNIGDGEFIDEYAHVSQEHFESLWKHHIEAGDLAIASLGQELPKACIIPETVGPALVKADCIRFSPHRAALHPEYALAVLNAQPTRSRTEDAIHGVGRPRLNLGQLRALAVPLPPLAEQVSIVEAIDERLSIADAVAAELDRQRARAGRLRQAILKRAFAGELVPQDPTDEPASVLLGRVQKELAEREKTPKPRKRKHAMSSHEHAPPTRLIDIVRDRGPLSPQALWEASKGQWETPEGEPDLDAFYKALKVEVVQTERLREDTQGDERLIVLA